MKRTPIPILIISIIIIILFAAFSYDKGLLTYLPHFTAQLTPADPQPTSPTPPDSDWYMAGANPQRTSWVSEEVRGSLKVEWYKPIKPYIAQEVQVIAAEGKLFISTARGLYAIDADTGDEVWVYPTELPLGHSPTVVNGIAYVGGFDRKLHAIDTQTGKALWTYEAEKGFQTNPLVANNTVYAGNRDSYMYAVDATTGDLIWKYKTDGPILYSAAYKAGVIYFASNDSYAYALDATTGHLIWKSAKLPGAGFHSWWPVIYDNFVILSGSQNYATSHVDRDRFLYAFPDGTYPDSAYIGPVTTEPDGSTTIHASKITEYFEQKPWRRTVFYLHRATGEEYTFDSDRDGQPEYAPILFQGTHSGTRYPPIVGGDGVIYQANNYYYSGGYIPWGNIVGWRVGTPYLIKVPEVRLAVDEPLVYTGGGNLIHWNLCCDRRSEAFDVTIPGSQWVHWGWGELERQIPGYHFLWSGGITGGDAVYGAPYGIYGNHGEQNPPIPYRGRVYTHRSNVILALSEKGTGGDVGLPLAEEVSAPPSSPPDLTEADLKQLLEAEVTQILTAGHLQPGFVRTGLTDFQLRCKEGSENLMDYWSAPGDIIYYLTRIYPHLSPTLQQQIRDYLQTEFKNFPPYQYVHIGWADGRQREVFDRPPEDEAARVSSGPEAGYRCGPFRDEAGDFAPHQFYAMWKYAQLMDDPLLSAQIFNNSKHRLDIPPVDDYLIRYPYVHNAYIAGFIGYINLGTLADPEAQDPDIQQDLQEKQTELDRLFQLRVDTFSRDVHFGTDTSAYSTFKIAGNFMFMVPELADYLRVNLFTEITEAIEEYENVAPYWFVSKHEATYLEGVTSPLFNYHAMFQAKAQILKEPKEELLKYLDVPGVKIGDLFYIDNLISAIEVVPLDETPPSQVTGVGPTAITEFQINLSWSEANDPETEIAHYRIYRDGHAEPIGTPTSTQFSDTDLSPDTSYTYEVSAVNADGLEGPKSAPAMLTTLSDITKLTIVSVDAPSETQVIVTFSEAADQATAQTAANYTIDYGITVLSAALSDSESIILTTSLLSQGVTYILTVNNVEDLAGNPIALDSQTTFFYDLTLVGHWKLDEGKGDIAFDSSSYGNDGTVIGATWVSGRDGSALSFDGADDYVQLPTSSYGQTYTLSFWGKANTTSGNHTFIGGYLSFVYITSSRVYHRFNARGYSGGDIAHGVTITDWHNYTIVRDGTSTFYLYVDGIYKGSDAPTQDQVFNSWHGNYSLGRWRNNLTPVTYTDYFNGLIDDIRIYNRALSAEEIALLAGAEYLPPPPTPISSIELRPLLEADPDINDNDFTLTIYNPATLTEITRTTYQPISGSITLSLPDIPQDQYDITVSCPYFLTKKLTSLYLSADLSITLPFLPAGDLNQDNTINSLDWSLMSPRWFLQDPIADLNKDNLVNTLDWSFMNGNWQARGEE